MKRTAILLVLMILASTVPAEDFGFAYHTGDRFRILSTVDEEVYVNRRFSHRAAILNRISFSVKDEKDGAGLLDGDFLTSEKGEGALQAYQWSEEYPSVFWRSKRGQYTIDRQYFMPVVRDVPTFPERDLKPGDTWTAPATEVHDFRNDFGIPEPFVIPLNIQYQFVGKASHDGKDYDLVTANYTVFYEPAPPSAFRTVYPANVMGYSDQQLFWDPEHGEIAAYTEKFKFIFVLSDGTVVEYHGSAKADQYEAERMDKDKVSADVQGQIDALQIPDASVQKTDSGVTISLSNIQFLPDSATLVPSELEKLRKIGDILKRYPDRDLLVAGHTALAGTPEGRQKLSEDRAKTVGDFLLRSGVRSQDRIVTRGFGADKPVADNATEEGKSRNRRVEITILEN
jgi:outer membrane protein OmpA-like peptidoglycan-associated protein